jgi:hypothetical protein
MGIAGDKPRQLAPTVGTTGSRSTDSPAPSPTTTKIDIDTIIGIAAPNNVDTTTKIDIDTVIGIAASTNVDTTISFKKNVDTTTKINIDTVIGIAAPTNVDTTTKIDIDTIVGIAVPAVVDANPAEPEVDAVDSTVIDSVLPSTANLTPAANVIDPTSCTTGTAPGAMTWPSDCSTSTWTATGRWNCSPSAIRPRSWLKRQHHQPPGANPQQARY